MKTKKVLLALLLTLFSKVSTYSQEKEIIENTLKTYFDGWKTGDTIKLGKVIHATCKLKSIKEDKIQVIDRKTYLSRFELRPALPNTEGKILNIDVTGNSASVKSVIETPELLITDYFNLLKINNQWFIVDKIFFRATKTK
jgi:hypothetical protein